MPLTITQGATAIAPGMYAYVLGHGGTSPYVYSIVSGGGSINSSSGLYTAPATTGAKVLRVTDALAATADATIVVGTALELFCDIIKTELSLNSNQVYLWDQKVNIPTDSELYVAVAMLNCKPFGNTTKFDGSGNAIQSVNMQATLSVDILSRSLLAVTRKEEVILALNSIYSQQQQERNSFYVAPISNGFVNLSQEDGAAIPYRFNISVNVQYFVTKTKAVPYYDDFDDVVVTTEA